METESPTTAPRARVWLLAALGIALVALVAYQMWPQPAVFIDPVSGQRLATPATGEVLDPAELKVKLEALATQRPPLGDGERNPFRFLPPPAPPPPPKSPTTAVAPIVPTGPPPPPPIPPIPLKFMGTVEKPGLTLAALTDCKGYSYAAREGEVVDGRYKVVKIQVESVILEYSNGTGRTTVRKSGDCPR